MTHRSRTRLKSTRPDPNLRFEKKQIVQILTEIEQGLSRNAACKKYGVAYDTVGNWLKTYGSKYFHAQKKPIYSVAFKRDIVQTIREGKMTRKEASVSYNIKPGSINS